MRDPGWPTTNSRGGLDMAVADDLEQARSALTMINQDPFNAEAPPEALRGEITPTELHYVRSNFAVPAHDGTLEVGGAVENPTTLTLDDLRGMPPVERAVTLECAGNGRLEMRPLPVGEPWGDYAVSTARWTGALLAHRAPLVGRRVREVVEADRRPARAVRRRVSDRPLHLRVARSSARTGRLDARARPHHRTRPRHDHRRRHIHRARKGVGGHRTGDAGRPQLHRRKRLALG